jgi:adenylate kinase
LTDNKTVILISNVFTWGDTPLKTTPSEEGVSVIEESKIETSQDPIKSEISIKKTRKKFLPYDDLEFNMRKAYPKYESWKTLENLCLSCNKTEYLTGYVLCAGIMYGLGEISLAHHFMMGWLGEVDSLPYISPGDNIIPTVHIKDLGHMVYYIFSNRPVQNYLIGCDLSSDHQLSIVQAISGAMSDGKINGVAYQDALLESWAEPMSLHMLISCSSTFQDDLGSFKWHSRDGIVANIDLLNQEFNLYRGLRSVKVYITGPPVSGKSHYSRKIAENYNIPHLHLSHLIQEVLQSSSDLAERIKKKLAELKQHMIEEAESKKKKNQEIDYSKFNPRIPEELISEVVRSKLNSNICRNRGYVLDGWPKRHEDAKRLFTKEDETLDTDLFPDSVVLLKATNEFLLSRAKLMPEQLVLGTHYNDEGMKRRLQVYRESNAPDKQTLYDFFISHKSEVFEMDATIDETAGLENIIKYIERNGKPLKYSPRLENNPDNNLASLESIKNLKDDDSKKAEPRQNVEYLIMLEQIRSKENSLLELKSQPIRNYLMEKVAPAITDGLFALCAAKPNDPVVFLAEYLAQKSSSAYK